MPKFKLWWALLILTFLLTAVAVKNSIEFKADRLDVAEARANPPDPIRLGDLLATPAHPPLSEVAVYDIIRYRSGVDALAGNDRAYLVMESDSSPSVFLVFFGPATDLDFYHLEADGLEADWDSHIIRGTLSDSTLYRSEIIDLMHERAPNMTEENTIMAEYLGADREAGYDHLLFLITFLEGLSWTLSAIGAAATAVAFMVSRRRRRQVQEG